MGTATHTFTQTCATGVGPACKPKTGTFLCDGQYLESSDPRTTRQAVLSNIHFIWRECLHHFVKRRRVMDHGSSVTRAFLCPASALSNTPSLVGDFQTCPASLAPLQPPSALSVSCSPLTCCCTVQLLPPELLIFLFSLERSDRRKWDSVTRLQWWHHKGPFILCPHPPVLLNSHVHSSALH